MSSQLVYHPQSVSWLAEDEHISIGIIYYTNKLYLLPVDVAYSPEKALLFL